MSLYKIPWREDFSFGTGISDFTGLPALKPWAFEDADRALLDLPQPDTAGNGNVSISKGIISETSHYKHALRASASVSVKLWGLVGVQASTKVLTELELNSQTSHYVVTCNFEKETLNSLDKVGHLPTLSNSARDLLIKIGPDKWAEQYGTHFVSGCVRGGKYVGKATITNHSTQGSHEFKAALKAKLGIFASGSASASVKFDHLKEKHDLHCNIDCIGANMALPQPKTIEQMVDLASEYAQNNKGVRHLAILLPFSALGSYNDAEAQYNGIRRSVPWQDSVRNLLTDLNFEYVRLQRLQFVLTDRTHLDRISDDVFSDAKQKVKIALGAFDELHKPDDIQKVNVKSPCFDKQLFDQIFVADAVEKSLSAVDTQSKVQPEAPHGDTLHSTRELVEGQKLVSADQKHHLIMQRDGNLVYYYRKMPIWASNTAQKGCGPYTLAMQEDRNLVVYGTPRNPIWHTGTNNRGVGPARLVMQDDGNIVIYDATNKPIWDAHTMGKAALLTLFSFMKT